MVLEGVVTNVTDFGAFVDVGVHQDGLVHISKLSDRFVKDPHKVVKVGDRLQVRVLDVDLERRRISLSARSEEGPRPGSTKDRGRSGEAKDRGSRPRGQKGQRPGGKPSKFTHTPFANLLNKDSKT
jgi:uncharacterized protein